LSLEPDEHIRSIKSLNKAAGLKESVDWVASGRVQTGILVEAFLLPEIR
jgi:hypothetical protein